MLLKLYLIAVVINWAYCIYICAACEKKLKRKGYKYIKKKKSISEGFVSFISTVFEGFDITNIIEVLCMGNQLYKYMEDKLLEQGKIYIPVEEESTSEGEFSLGDETKIYPESVEKVSFEKKYDEMTSEEKLAYLKREREILTGQSKTIIVQPIEEDSANIDQEQQKHVLRITMNPKRK